MSLMDNAKLPIYLRDGLEYCTGCPYLDTTGRLCPTCKAGYLPQYYCRVAATHDKCILKEKDGKPLRWEHCSVIVEVKS